MSRLLVSNQLITDPNYSIVYPHGRKKLIFRRGLNAGDREKQIRIRYAMVIHEDSSNVFKNLPCRHPLWDSSLDDTEPIAKQVYIS